MYYVHARLRQVVDKYVRPKTSAFNCCLFDLVPESSTGQPRYFVSHTWSRKLGALLKLLSFHFPADGDGGGDNAGGSGSGGSNSSVLLWLDIFAINQNPYAAKGALLSDDVANLAKVGGSSLTSVGCNQVHCLGMF